MAKVIVDRDLEKALKRFKRYTSKEGILSDYKDRQYYMSNTEKRRRRNAKKEQKKKQYKKRLEEQEKRNQYSSMNTQYKPKTR